MQSSLAVTFPPVIQGDQRERAAHPSLEWSAEIPFAFPRLTRWANWLHRADVCYRGQTSITCSQTAEMEIDPTVNSSRS